MKALESVYVQGFELLNDEKVQRALDAVGPNASEEQLLAEYDKLGGGIKKDGRKIALGSFYDFTAKKAIKDVSYDELEYEDELVVVRKPLETKSAKGLSTKERVTRLGKAKSAAAGKLAGAEKTADTAPVDEEVEEKKPVKVAKKTRR